MRETLPPTAHSTQFVSHPAYPLAGDRILDREYVPPPIFTQVREPQPIPRSDMKDQEAHRRGVEHWPEPSVAVRSAPAPAVPPPRLWCVGHGGHKRKGQTLVEAVRALLAEQPPGRGLTPTEIHLRVPDYVTICAVRHVLCRLRAAGEVQSRDLIRIGVAQAGRVCEYRIAQPGPWGDPPEGCCLPGQRPRRDVAGRNVRTLGAKA